MKVSNFIFALLITAAATVPPMSGNPVEPPSDTGVKPHKRSNVPQPSKPPAQNVSGMASGAVQAAKIRSDAHSLADAYFLKARRQLADGMGDTDEAVALINKAIELEPRDAKYYAGKANILWEMQERDQECLAAAQQACALDPGNGTHHQMCAQVLMRMGRLSEALAAIDQALKRHDRDPNLIILKASVLKAQGDLAGAEEAATTAITRMPSASSYRLERAQIRFARKNFAGAIEDTNLPLEKRNWHNMWEARSAWMLRARSYAMMQDKAHASATFLRAIQVCPSDRKLLVEAQAYFKSIADAANEQSIAKRIKDIDTDLTPPKMPI